MCLPFFVVTKVRKIVFLKLWFLPLKSRFNYYILDLRKNVV